MLAGCAVPWCWVGRQNLPVVGLCVRQDCCSHTAAIIMTSKLCFGLVLAILLPVNLCIAVHLNAAGHRLHGHVQTHAHGHVPRSSLEVVKQWKVFTYNFLPHAPVQDVNFYNPANILSTGLAVMNDRIFMATPKLFAGVPSTLSWISRGEFDESPVLNVSYYNFFSLVEVMENNIFFCCRPIRIGHIPPLDALTSIAATWFWFLFIACASILVVVYGFWMLVFHVPSRIMRKPVRPRSWCLTSKQIKWCGASISLLASSEASRCLQIW